MSIEAILKEHTRYATALEMIDGQFANVVNDRLKERRENIAEHYAATASALRSAYINALETQFDSGLSETFWQSVRTAVHQFFSLGDVYQLDMTAEEHTSTLCECVRDSYNLLMAAHERETILLDYFDDIEIDEVKGAIAAAKQTVKNAKSDLVRAYINALEGGADPDDLADEKNCVHGILDAEGVS